MILCLGGSEKIGIKEKETGGVTGSPEYQISKDSYGSHFQLLHFTGKEIKMQVCPKFHRKLMTKLWKVLGFSLHVQGPILPERILQCSTVFAVKNAILFYTHMKFCPYSVFLIQLDAFIQAVD